MAEMTCAVSLEQQLTNLEELIYIKENADPESLEKDEKTEKFKRLLLNNPVAMKFFGEKHFQLLGMKYQYEIDDMVHVVYVTEVQHRRLQQHLMLRRFQPIASKSQALFKTKKGQWRNWKNGKRNKVFD